MRISRQFFFVQLAQFEVRFPLSHFFREFLRHFSSRKLLFVQRLDARFLRRHQMTATETHIRTTVAPISPPTYSGGALGDSHIESSSKGSARSSAGGDGGDGGEMEGEGGGARGGGLHGGE